MIVAYGTILTIAFLPRALVLYRSLLPWKEENRFFFFCLDSHSEKLLRSLNLTHAIIVSEKEFVDLRLLPARDRLLLREYCWACKPSCIDYMFRSTPQAEWSVYLDSDMLAFSNPSAELEKVEGAFGVLTRHRYSPDMAHWADPAGQHNAGYAAFRRQREIDEVLNWWTKQCLQRPPFEERKGETFDQKILDEMEKNWRGIVDSVSKGLNTAPWNMDGYSITQNNSHVFVDDDILSLFHFQGLRVHGAWIFDAYCGSKRISPLVMKYIYRPYLKALRECYLDIRKVKSGFNHGIVPLFSDLDLVRHHFRLLRRAQSNLSVVIG